MHDDDPFLCHVTHFPLNRIEPLISQMKCTHLEKESLVRLRSSTLAQSYLKEIDTVIGNQSNTESTIGIDHLRFRPDWNLFNWRIRDRSIHVSISLNRLSLAIVAIVNQRDLTVFELIWLFSNSIVCSSHRRRNREKRIFSIKFFACGTRQSWIDPCTINLYRWEGFEDGSRVIFSSPRFDSNRCAMNSDQIWSEMKELFNRSSKYRWAYLLLTSMTNDCSSHTDEQVWCIKKIQRVRLGVLTDMLRFCLSVTTEEKQEKDADSVDFPSFSAFLYFFLWQRKSHCAFRTQRRGERNNVLMFAVLMHWIEVISSRVFSDAWGLIEVALDRFF